MTNQFSQNQSGAVLAVSLMFLLVASLVAVASIDNSLVQERMATNHQNMNRAFQAAESAIDDHITTVTEDGDLSLLSTARSEGDKDTPAWPTASFDPGSTHISTGMVLEYKGEVVLSSGNTIDADESTINISAMRFEYVATSTIQNTGATIDVVQGIEYR